jgi:osomolarity two-component system, sensor histidine kinase SLN1
MSSSSTRREFPVKKPLDPLPPRSGRSLSLDDPDSDPEATVLPPPITTTYNRPKKTLRIDGGRGLHVYWIRFRRRLGAGTAPSTSSLVDSSAQGSNDGFRSDTQGGHQGDDEAEVDEVVVDRNWSDEIKSSVSLSEQDVPLDRPGGHNVAGPNTDRDSVALHTGGFWGLSTPLIILRWRVFPAVVDFFSTRFPNKKSEQHYVKENWFMRKVRRPSWAIHISSSHTLYFGACRRCSHSRCGLLYSLSSTGLSTPQLFQRLLYF